MYEYIIIYIYIYSTGIIDLCLTLALFLAVWPDCRIFQWVSLKKLSISWPPDNSIYIYIYIIKTYDLIIYKKYYTTYTHTYIYIHTHPCTTLAIQNLRLARDGRGYCCLSLPTDLNELAHVFFSPMMSRSWFWRLPSWQRRTLRISVGTWMLCPWKPWHMVSTARLTATPAMPWGGLQDVGECSGRRRFLRHDMSWDTLWDTSWHVVRHGGEMYQEQNLRCFTSKLILENARKVKQIDDLQCTFSVLSVRLQMMFGIESCRSRDDLL